MNTIGIKIKYIILFARSLYTFYLSDSGAAAAQNLSSVNIDLLNWLKNEGFKNTKRKQQTKKKYRSIGRSLV